MKSVSSPPAGGYVLGVETATEQMSIALRSYDAEDPSENPSSSLEAELTLRHGRDLSRVLLPAIQQTLQLRGIGLGSIGFVAVSVGPGSFTGLRIGVTAAKVLAHSLNIPTVPVSTLAALCCELSSDVPEVIAVMDARRGEVFLSRFIHGSRVDEDCLATVDELVELLTAQPAARMVTPPTSRPWLPVNGVWENRIVTAFPRAAHVARLGLQWFRDGKTTHPEALVPAYLRRSYAEEQRSPVDAPTARPTHHIPDRS